MTAGARAIEERAAAVRRAVPPTVLAVVFRFLLQLAGVACGVLAVWHTWGFGAGLAACAVGAFLIEYIVRPEDSAKRRT